MIIIGDIHGCFDKYLNITNKAENTIQLGDFGFDYDKVLSQVDPNKHRIVPGNHENYHTIGRYPHFLGDYGKVPNIPRSFFLRGGYSIDRARRTPGLDWFPEEELGHIKGLKAIEAYKRAKPDIMFSHTSPAMLNDELVRTVGGIGLQPSYTSRLLQIFFDYHQPSLWFFAHWHTSWSKKHNNTQFICLNVLETYQGEFR